MEPWLYSLHCREYYLVLNLCVKRWQSGCILLHTKVGKENIEYVGLTKLDLS